jgi:hypothetical protein
MGFAPCRLSNHWPAKKILSSPVTPVPKLVTSCFWVSNHSNPRATMFQSNLRRTVAATIPQQNPNIEERYTWPRQYTDWSRVLTFPHETYRRWTLFTHGVQWLLKIFHWTSCRPMHDYNFWKRVQPVQKPPHPTNSTENFIAAVFSSEMLGFLAPGHQCIWSAKNITKPSPTSTIYNL